MQDNTSPTVCVVHEGSAELELAFIRAHVERLPCRTVLLHGFVPHVQGRPVLSQMIPARGMRKFGRLVRGASWDEELTIAYLSAFRRYRPAAVLAEWGTVAVRVMDACRIANVPLIAHFHGYDASVYTVVEQLADAYRRLFEVAHSVVAVSNDMRRKLISLGAPPAKVHYNSYGVDLAFFTPDCSVLKEPTFVAVGRFVEKKAPQITLTAFAQVVEHVPAARLVMVGDGPLLGMCQSLASALGIAHAVEFAGKGTGERIRDRLRGARAFVQHSVVASDGDSEGTPNVVLEAGAMGIPVVATRHGGIPDAIIDGETGYLVAEHDAHGMSDRMLALAVDAQLAAQLGKAARLRIEQHFSVDKSITGLWQIIEHAIATTVRTSV